MVVLEKSIEYFIFLSGCISMFAALYQFSHSRDSIARWSSFVMLGISLNLFCYIFLKMDMLPVVGRILVFLQVISYLLLDVSYLIFVLYFTGRTRWINKLTMIFLVSVPVIIVGLLVYQWGSLPTTILTQSSGFGVENNLNGSSSGIIAILFVVYSTFIGFAALLLLASMYSNAPPHYRRTYLGLMIGNLLITAAGMLEILGANPFSQVSLLQFAVALSAIPIILIVFNWKDINSIPITHKLLNDTLRDGYLIVNPQYKVIDYNLAMQTLIGDGSKIKTGCSLSDILPNLELPLHQAVNSNLESEMPLLYETPDCIYQVKVYPIEGERKETIGSLVVFHNISAQEKLEEALLKQRQSIVQTNALLSGLAEVNLKIQTTNDISSIYQILSHELTSIDLNCFVLLTDADSSELVIRHVSSREKDITQVEKILSSQLIGYHLDRRTFPQIYSYLKREATDCSRTTFHVDQAFGGLVSSKQIEEAFQIVGIEPDTPVTVLQLNAGEKMLGLFGIWGKDLGQDDLAPLRIFASQVAWAIERIDLYNYEVQRSTELTRSNQLITALANVTTQVGTSDDSSKALETLGEALEKIELHCLMGTVDGSGEIITFKYASFYHRIRALTEKIPGFDFIDYQLPKKLWPGSKVVKEGVPVWYHNPINIFDKMFPMLPKNLFQQALKRIGISPEDNLCILPLIINGQVNGILAIWGSSIQDRDTPTLMVFAHQVAEILRKTQIYEDELARANRLNRTNNMIVALSNVAAHLETTSNITEVFETLSGELKKVELNCLVCTFDESKQELKVDYGSLPRFKDWTAGAGIQLSPDLRIPRQLWPKAILEKKPEWEPDLIEFTGNLLPFGSTKLFRKTIEKAGFSLDDPACFLPMIVEEDVVGLLAVRGPNLTEDDIPGLSVFANQVATAIKNTTLFHQAQQEITSRTQAEANLQEALSEKEVLLKEIHHRVKNNLQIISSLLNLQIRQSNDPNTTDGLRDSQNRVRAMALIHEKLYQSDDLAQINFSAYLRSLTSYLAQTYRIDPNKVSIEVEADNIMLDLDTAVPCGLIVNELVTNSLKYAYPDGKTGCIQVSCHQTDNGNYNLVVGDDGIGLPAGFDLGTNTSLGLKLVSSLVRQIEGQMEVKGQHGTRLEIHFSRLKD